MSYANLIIYSATLPSYNTDKKGKKTGGNKTTETVSGGLGGLINRLQKK